MNLVTAWGDTAGDTASPYGSAGVDVTGFWLMFVHTVSHFPNTLAGSLRRTMLLR